jgi:UDP-N-acetylmuramyl pentapeptide synthase
MPSSAILQFPDADSVIRALLPRIAAEDTVLIKASHSLRGDRIAEAIRKSR